MTVREIVARAEALSLAATEVIFGMVLCASLVAKGAIAAGTLGCLFVSMREQRRGQLYREAFAAWICVNRWPMSASNWC